MPTYRLFHESIAARCQLIRYDGRGSGLSERNPADISIDGRVLDVEAVRERLDLSEFDLWAWGPSGFGAVAYAARYPQRLRHLVLWDSAPHRLARASSLPRFDAIMELASRDWELFTETVASVMFGWSAAEDARKFAVYMRQAVSQEMVLRATQQVYQDDVRALIPSLIMPTLVLQTREAFTVNMEMATELTSLLPNASLAILDGTWITTDELARQAAGAILDFVAADDGAPAPDAGSSGTVTILFTDITDSTALTQRLGDVKAQELVRAHNAIVREALAAHGGTEIKHTGDGIMASFPTASGALECAVAIQRGVALRRAQGDEGHAGPIEAGLAVHIGLNAGEPVAEEQDLFGTAVQLARRICDHAEAGQILASDVVRQLAAGKGFEFADIGEVVPKGFEEPVRLYEVRWRE